MAKATLTHAMIQQELT